MSHFDIIGRLTHDPRSFSTKQGKLGCSFSIAENSGEEALYYNNITAYNHVGKHIFTYKKRGDQVAIWGYIKPRKWVDKHGTTHDEKDLFVTQCKFLSSPNRTEEPVVETPEPTETVPRKIACSLCEKTFTTARGLKVHLARSHKSIDFPPNEAQRELVEREQAGRTFTPTEYDGCDVPLLLEVGASDES